MVSTYHAAGAVRDVAKALGLPPDQITALADCCGRWTDNLLPPERLRCGGIEGLGRAPVPGALDDGGNRVAAAALC